MASSSNSHCINPAGIRKGVWSKEEDLLLRSCIEKYGEGNWHLVPSRAGLNRCRKSCRLRWLNYLSPNIKRDPFAPDEDDLIIRMQRLLGNRWSLIAGRMLGRTANDIKNRWNYHLCKKMVAHQRPKEAPPIPSAVVVKPQAYRPTVKAPHWFKSQQVPTAEKPAGNFTEEQFYFSSWFDPFSNQGRGVEVGRGGGGGELEAPPQTGEEALLLPEILIDLDGKESPLQATTAPTPAELELHPEILLDLDGRELPHKATTTPTDQSELEWEKLLSDPEFWSTFDIRGGTTGAQAEEPAGNFTEEQFCFSSSFDPFNIQGRGVEVGRGELEAPHQTGEEALLLPEILFDLDGKESPLQATTAPTPAELEWLPEIFLDLDGRELPPQATTAPTDQAELEWEKLLSDPEFWSTFDISGGTTGAQAPSDSPKDDDHPAI